MKNKSNNIISPESDDTEDINLLLDDFETALKKEYIIPIINKMIYIIQNNTLDLKIHEEFEYLKFIQQNINPYVTLFIKLTYKEMKLFCLKLLNIQSKYIVIYF